MCENRKVGLTFYVKTLFANVSAYRSDEIEMISKQRKPSGVSGLKTQPSQESGEATVYSPDDAGYSSSEYSPMNGAAAAREPHDEDEEDTEAPLLSVSQQDYYRGSEELNSYGEPSYLHTSSYVPTGYIVLEPGRRTQDEHEGFQKFSVSSV